MSLADYQPIREEVKSRKGGFSVTVRGLSIDDFTMLFNKHLNDINKLFDLHGKALTMDKFSETMQIATRLVSEAPDVAARVIALACDEPDQMEKARKLVVPLQIEVIKKVLQLTFDEAGGIRNFLTGLRQIASAVIPSLRTDSNT